MKDMENRKGNVVLWIVFGMVVGVSIASIGYLAYLKYPKSEDKGANATLDATSSSSPVSIPVASSPSQVATPTSAPDGEIVSSSKLTFSLPVFQDESRTFFRHELAMLDTAIFGVRKLINPPSGYIFFSGYDHNSYYERQNVPKILSSDQMALVVDVEFFNNLSSLTFNHLAYEKHFLIVANDRNYYAINSNGDFPLLAFKPFDSSRQSIVFALPKILTEAYLLFGSDVQNNKISGGFKIDFEHKTFAPALEEVINTESFESSFSKIHAAQRLGGLNLNNYCSSIEPLSKASFPGDIWRCIPGGAVIDMNKACRWQYLNQDVIANQDTAGDPYSWVCYAIASSGY